MSSTQTELGSLELRTGAWYGDPSIALEFPPEWDVTFFWPRTPPRLTDSEIVQKLESPVGQLPVREICRGKSRPLIIVDDVNRPTPVARIMPFLLRQFEQAGITPDKITILMGRGSHGAPSRESMVRKIGDQASTACRLVLHDPTRNTTKIGTTPFGTPVHVNREVLGADFIMGIGGVYPNNTAGFGGGSKLVLGILDLRVISLLHRRHKGQGWGAEALQCDFRRDLDEIARMIGLQTLVTLHVDASRELVRMNAGDYTIYLSQEVGFAREVFRAPKPDFADVVISNAFPNDLSLTFIHMKGVYPLRHAPAHASRIVLGACSEGEGFHGVYPIVRAPLLHEQRDRLRRISLMSPNEIARTIKKKLARAIRRGLNGKIEPTSSGMQPKFQTRPAALNPIWLYRTGSHTDVLPSPVRGIRVLNSWSEVLERVRKEQQGRTKLKAVIYPCAPLQVLE